jgi:hypothetical protein
MAYHPTVIHDILKLPEVPVLTITKETINAFKAHWPCSGIPDEVDLVVCVFDTTGGKRDLIDYEVSGADDSVIDPDTMPDAGAALSALMDIELALHLGATTKELAQLYAGGN